MHLDFADALNLVSTVTLIGALVFTGLQVRAADRARREQAAVTVIETAALSENSARFLELLSEIPEGASARKRVFGAGPSESFRPDWRRSCSRADLRLWSNRHALFRRRERSQIAREEMTAFALCTRSHP